MTVTAHTDQTRPTLSVSEAAALLGVSRWLVLQQIKEGNLPHRRFGRRIIISRRVFTAWLEGAEPAPAIPSAVAPAALQPLPAATLNEGHRGADKPMRARRDEEKYSL
jgi:excisionase family DNA binding protein